MKRKSIILIIFGLLTGIVALSCGDGSHRTTPTWSASTSGGSQAVQDINIYESKLTCVDVTNYEDFEDAAVVPEQEELTPGNITNQQSVVGFKENYEPTPADVNAVLLTPDTKAVTSENSVASCIKQEIKKIQKSAHGTFYWGNYTSLLIRDEIYKKPKKGEVEIVGLESCEQVKSAKCLLVK